MAGGDGVVRVFCLHYPDSEKAGYTEAKEEI